MLLPCERGRGEILKNFGLWTVVEGHFLHEFPVKFEGYCFWKFFLSAKRETQLRGQLLFIITDPRYTKYREKSVANLFFFLWSSNIISPVTSLVEGFYLSRMGWILVIEAFLKTSNAYFWTDLSSLTRFLSIRKIQWVYVWIQPLLEGERSKQLLRRLQKLALASKLKPKKIFWINCRYIPCPERWTQKCDEAVSVARSYYRKTENANWAIVQNISAYPSSESATIHTDVTKVKIRIRP